MINVKILTSIAYSYMACVGVCVCNVYNAYIDSCYVLGCISDVDNLCRLYSPLHVQLQLKEEVIIKEHWPLIGCCRMSVEQTSVGFLRDFNHFLHCLRTGRKSREWDIPLGG